MFDAIETSLSGRLKDALPDVHVLTAADLDNVTSDRQPSPAVHLVYRGYRVEEVRADGKVALVSQQWLAVAVAKNVRSIRQGYESRSAAGGLADQVLQALMGFVPDGARHPLTLIDAPAPVYLHGVAYFPTAFSVKTPFSVGAQQ